MKSHDTYPESRLSSLVDLWALPGIDWEDPKSDKESCLSVPDALSPIRIIASIDWWKWYFTLLR